MVIYCIVQKTVHPSYLGISDILETCDLIVSVREEPWYTRQWREQQDSDVVSRGKVNEMFNYKWERVSSPSHTRRLHIELRRGANESKNRFADAGSDDGGGGGGGGGAKSDIRSSTVPVMRICGWNVNTSARSRKLTVLHRGAGRGRRGGEVVLSKRNEPEERRLLDEELRSDSRQCPRWLEQLR